MVPKTRHANAAGWGNVFVYMIAVEATGISGHASDQHPRRQGYGAITYPGRAPAPSSHVSAPDPIASAIRLALLEDCA